MKRFVYKPREATAVRGQRAERLRRRRVIDDLIVELESGSDGVVQLYAALLMRTFVAADAVLAQEYGRRLTALLCEDEATHGRAEF